jgi:hypothetical protein
VSPVTVAFESVFVVLIYIEETLLPNSSQYSTIVEEKDGDKCPSGVVHKLLSVAIEEGDVADCVVNDMGELCVVP